MKVLSGHKNYLIQLYLKNFVIVTLIFASLIFVLNVLEEVSFFNNLNFSALILSPDSFILSSLNDN